MEPSDRGNFGGVMRLDLTVPLPRVAPPPDDPEMLALVHATIAKQATSWTEPVFLGQQDGHYRYTTDAVPR